MNVRKYLAPATGAAFVSLAMLPFCLAGASQIVAEPGVAKARLNPAGVNGSLILCGQGQVPRAALNRFLELARGKAARVVILRLGVEQESGSDPSFTRQLFHQAEEMQVAAITLLRLPSTEAANSKDLLPPLTTATAVWIVGNGPVEIERILKGSTASAEIQGVIRRGGVVAGHNKAAAALSLLSIDRNGRATTPGLGLLPDAVVELAPANGSAALTLPKVLKNHPGLAGIEIAPNTALVVRGRRLYALGNGKVTLHLESTSWRPARQIVLEPGRDEADLTALRWAALARSQPEFPAKNPAAPVVEKGTLIIVGGGGMPKGLLRRFVDLAGGPKSFIVVLPTAVPDPILKEDSIAAVFRKLGAGKVVTLPQRNLADIEGPEVLGALRQATGIWFGGGRQWRFVDAYLDTKAHPLMKDVLRRGGVIGGSSAGASIQAEYLARGDPLGNLEIMAEGYERGLGFLPGVAVDQHFSQRKRHKDMSRLVRTYPQLLGIGIDETTAILVQGHVAEVVGQGKVFFFDGRRKVVPGQPDYETVAAGGRYDLQARHELLPAGSE
jgi:cyanophycinase